MSEHLKVAIVIPTYRRIEKLKRCLLSIAGQSYNNFDTFITCDNNDKETFDWLLEQRQIKSLAHVQTVSLSAQQKFVIGAWNDFFKFQFGFSELMDSDYGAVLWCVDDVELLPNTLANSVKCMITNFPDTDGVIGIKQECPGHPEYTFKWYGQCLIGRRFIQRYANVDYQVCCPDYNHFYQDEEMWEYSTSLGKFVNCEEAVLKHYHPGFIKEEMDDTHPLVRGVIARADSITRAKRKEHDLTWGKSWTLVNRS